MSDIVMANVWRKCGQRGIKRLVMIALAGEVTSRGTAEFHHADLAAKCACEVETISAYLRQLATEGEIEYEPASGRGATCKVWMPAYGEALSRPPKKVVKAVNPVRTSGLSANENPVNLGSPSDLSGVSTQPAARPAPPTRVVSSPPSGETKDQEHQSSGAKAPSDCSAAVPPKASRARARAKVGPLYGDLFVAVRSACRLGSGGLGKVDGRLVSDAAKDLERIGATPADVEAAMPRWYAEDWRGKKGQPPTPTQLVTWVTQCRATPAGSPTTTHPTGDGSEDLAKWGDIFVAHAAMDKEARR